MLELCTPYIVFRSAGNCVLYYSLVELAKQHILKMATSAEATELDKIRAELICSICLGLLDEPKKMDCDHSFCQNCLETYIHHQCSPTPPSPTEPPQEPQARVIVCACCQQETKLPDNGVEGLKTNFKLKNLVEILGAQEREKTVAALGKGHQKTHQSVPNCEQHSEKSVFFCHDCCVLFCRYCIPSHKEHKWDNYDTVLTQYKEDLRSAIQPAYEAAQSAFKAMQELENDKDAVTQNHDTVKGKVREYFSELVAKVQQREETILKMTDRYTEAKMENLHKLCDQLQKGHEMLLQNLQKIETLMQEDSTELLTGKDRIKTKMMTHRNTINRALPKSEDVDTFIELKVDSEIPVDTLGRLVFCQRNPRSGLVSTVQDFVLSTDMDHIHLDLARPLDNAIPIPDYIQFRYAQPPQTDEEDAYVDISATMPLNRSAQPLPAIPFGEQSASYSTEVAYAEVRDPATKHITPHKVECAEEDPYAAIEELHIHIPNRSTPKATPVVMQPLEVIDLRNANVQVSGITCTSAFSNVIVTDTNNCCLRILYKGQIVETIGQPDIKFCKPVAIATNSTNDMFVLDQDSKTIFKLRLDGRLLYSFPTKPRKGPEKPWDIAISPDDTIYISDWSRRRVYVYSGENGKKIRSIKGCYERGTKDEFLNFSRPAGIAFDRGGLLMIADRGERCVWCINTDGDEFIKKIGMHHLQNPYGIAVAQNGKIIVTESESNCVFVFSEDGKLLNCFGGTGAEHGQLCSPHHVFVGENKNIYIADTHNQRVQIFTLSEDNAIYQNVV